MKLPARVKIGGHVYRISFRKSLAKKRPALWGYVDSAKHVICINPESPVIDTLLHEIVHAGEFTVGGDLTEDQVDTIARLLCSFIADNKPLLRWLMDQLG